MQSKQETELFSYENTSTDNSKKDDFGLLSLKRLRAKDSSGEVPEPLVDKEKTSSPVHFEEENLSKKDLNGNKSFLETFSFLGQQRDNIPKSALDLDVYEQIDQSEIQEETFTDEEVIKRSSGKKSKKLQKAIFSNGKLNQESEIEIENERGNNDKNNHINNFLKELNINNNYYNNNQNKKLNSKLINCLTKGVAQFMLTKENSETEAQQEPNTGQEREDLNFSLKYNQNICLNQNFIQNASEQVLNNSYMQKLVEFPSNFVNEAESLSVHSSNETYLCKQNPESNQNQSESNKAFTKRKYIKSKDIDASQQKYSCKLCGKIYISYPAFYTHKRNRHNIISITNRHDLLKSSGTEGNTVKYNYNSIGFGKTINFEFSDYLINTLKKTMEKIYCCENSLFFCKEADKNPAQSHIFLQYLEKYKVLFSQKIEIPPAHFNLPIDEILIVYFILFAKVTNENTLIELAAVFITYFREYLNIHGFDYYTYFVKFGLFDDPKPSNNNVNSISAMGQGCKANASASRVNSKSNSIFVNNYLNKNNYNNDDNDYSFQKGKIILDLKENHEKNNFKNSNLYDLKNNLNLNGTKNQGIVDSDQSFVFTQQPLVHYIPDLAEDFIFSFMKIPEISIPFGNLDNMESLCKNLCNWLFVNELSNLKLIVPEKKRPGYFIGVNKKT